VSESHVPEPGQPSSAPRDSAPAPAAQAAENPDVAPQTTSGIVRAGAAHRRGVWGLGFLFGAIYFIQGIAEPTSGLIAQPVQTSLEDWHYSPTRITQFMFIVGLPWAIKPVFGLISDCLPIWGSRRRIYLILATTATAVSLGYLFWSPPTAESMNALLPLLFVACVGVAFSDVLADALMVEKGQPRGITGTLQSVQWTAMYSATILTGFLGGYLSSRHWQPVGYLICAIFTGLTFFLAIFCVREERAPASAETLRIAVRALGRGALSPMVLTVAVFLFLWNFNPFSNAVLQFHMTKQLDLGSGFYGLSSEEFYGITQSVIAVGSVLGSLSYGFYCRRVPMKWLIHLSIVTGIIATVAYWGLVGPWSALIVSFYVGFTYMTGSLVQLDLAARVCPPAAAGTTFALLMSVCNLSLSLATMAGGALYDQYLPEWGPTNAFNLLVAVGAAATAASWGLVARLNRHAAAAA
jgi:predicted MFS family arabinose efflux permease